MTNETKRQLNLVWFIRAEFVQLSQPWKQNSPSFVPSVWLIYPKLSVSYQRFPITGTPLNLRAYHFLHRFLIRLQNTFSAKSRLILFEIKTPVVVNYYFFQLLSSKVFLSYIMCFLSRIKFTKMKALLKDERRLEINNF